MHCKRQAPPTHVHSLERSPHADSVANTLQLRRQPYDEYWLETDWHWPTYIPFELIVSHVE